METISLNFDPTVIKLSYEREKDHVKVSETIDIVDLTTIYPDRINELLCTIPPKAMFWASTSEQVSRHAKELKNSRDSRLAAVSLEIRNHWDEVRQGKKTEKAIEDLAKSDEEYCRLVAELEQAEFFALQTTRIKEVLQMVSTHLGILSANLRQSGEATLAVVPVIRESYTQRPENPPEPAQKANSEDGGQPVTPQRPTKILRRLKTEEPVQ
jgi:hypothetical protein